MSTEIEEGSEMRVLVTGGAGFIGSHLVDALLAKGDAVTVIDNLSSGSLDNLKTHTGNPAFRFIQGDIRDAEAVKRALVDADAIIHEAAMISVPLSIKDPELAYSVNVDGTLTLLKSSLERGVKRFVYASSCAVYAGVMIKFLERLHVNQPPIIYGDGEQTRDFVHVGDIVGATLLALEREGIAGEVLNIGTGKATSINELCRIFLAAAGKTRLKPIHEATRPGDIKYSQADVTKAMKLLGFKSKISLEEGVGKLLEGQK